jgi:DivIVA domain-containing protein
MTVTPENIRSKLFTTVRLRSGYEQAEVDEFLDETEAELGRRLGPAPTGDAAASAADRVADSAARFDETIAAKLAAPGHMFSRVMLRESYDLGQVDEFVASVALALDEARPD